MVCLGAHIPVAVVAIISILSALAYILHVQKKTFQKTILGQDIL
jgi:hypothetical protein